MEYEGSLQLIQKHITEYHALSFESSSYLNEFLEEDF